MIKRIINFKKNRPKAFFALELSSYVIALILGYYVLGPIMWGF